MQPLTQSDIETIELRQIIYCEKIPNTGILLYTLDNNKKHIVKYIANTSIDIEVYKKLYMLLIKNADKDVQIDSRNIFTNLYAGMSCEIFINKNYKLSVEDNGLRFENIPTVIVPYSSGIFEAFKRIVK